MQCLPLAADRRARLKVAYTTRRVPLEAMAGLLVDDGDGDEPLRPACGDLVLARVDQVGQHKRLELPTGRRAGLCPGDEIVVVYGDRYAPDQFEAHVPETLEPCELVAGGGMASRVLSRHTLMRPATAITPLGLVADADGRRLRLRDVAVRRVLVDTPRPATVAVVGTAMNAGKTTSAANLVYGLDRAGLRVGSAKVTGTGSGGDAWALLDAGAVPALDITTAGYVSTYRVEIDEVVDILDLLVAQLTIAGCEAAVLEVADGLFQAETAALLRTRAFAETVDGVLFAAGDALGAVGGVAQLRSLGLPVLGVCGVLTSSPLARREAEAALDVPVVGLQELAEPELMSAMVHRRVLTATG